MIVNVIEVSMTGKEHSSFNAAFLAALKLAEVGATKEVHFWAEKTHYESIKSDNQEEIEKNVVYHQIKVIPGSKRKFLRKVVVEIVNVILVLKRSKKEGSSVIFLSTFAPTTVLLILINALYRKVPTHLVLHGLDGLIRQDKLRLNSYGLWNRMALLRFFRGNWPYAYVLGSGIRNRLIRFFPESPYLSLIRSIEHPYDFSSAEAECCNLYDSKEASSKPINIGFVGYGRKDKGVDLFYDLAEKMSDYVREKKVRFVLVGSLDPECAQYANCWVDYLEGSALLSSRKVYREAIRSLDCALMLGSEAYKLTASGSVLDIIAAGTKIISLPNEYVSDIAMFDEEEGINIFDTMAQVENEIRRYCEAGGFKKYEYRKIQNHYGIEALSKQLSVYLKV